MNIDFDENTHSNGSERSDLAESNELLKEVTV